MSDEGEDSRDTCFVHRESNTFFTSISNLRGNRSTWSVLSESEGWLLGKRFRESHCWLWVNESRNFLRMTLSRRKSRWYPSLQEVSCVSLYFLLLRLKKLRKTWTRLSFISDVFFVSFRSLHSKWTRDLFLSFLRFSSHTQTHQEIRLHSHFFRQQNMLISKESPKVSLKICHLIPWFRRIRASSSISLLMERRNCHLTLRMRDDTEIYSRRNIERKRQEGIKL